MKRTENLKYGVRYKGNEAEYQRLDSLARRRRDPVKYLVAQARYRAKREGLPCDITFENLIVPDTCPIFNIPLGFSEGRRTDGSYSLDRWDNTKGYVKGNVRVISWKANQYKGNMTIQDVENLLAYMKGEVL